MNESIDRTKRKAKELGVILSDQSVFVWGIDKQEMRGNG